MGVDQSDESPHKEAAKARALVVRGDGQAGKTPCSQTFN